MAGGGTRGHHGGEAEGALSEARKELPATSGRNRCENHGLGAAGGARTVWGYGNGPEGRRETANGEKSGCWGSAE